MIGIALTVNVPAGDSVTPTLMQASGSPSTVAELSGTNSPLAEQVIWLPAVGLMIGLPVSSPVPSCS
jgi:hypothetical protein